MLDEPTSQLDPQSAEEVLDSLVKLNKDLGLTIILSEHRLERVVQHADRILYMDPDGYIPDRPAPRDPRRNPPRPTHSSGSQAPWLAPPTPHHQGSPALRHPGLQKSDSQTAEGSEPSIAHRPPSDAEFRIPNSTFRIQDVWFAYAGREVLHGLTLEMRAGEITAIMGRNGAGKTTILKLITGLLKPSRGASPHSASTPAMPRSKPSQSLWDMFPSSPTSFSSPIPCRPK